jgi:hypothetical protein
MGNHKIAPKSPNALTMGTAKMFAGNADAGDALIRLAPQRLGVSCGGYALTYAILRTGVSRYQAGRQVDVTAVSDLTSVLNNPMGSDDTPPFTAFASGMMTPTQLQDMASFVYNVAQGYIAVDANGNAPTGGGYSAAQLACYASVLCAFGAFNGATFSIVLYKVPGDYHFMLLQNGTYANSLPDATNGTATVGPAPALPNSTLRATIDVASGVVSLTKNSDSGPQNKAPVGTKVTIPAATVSHDNGGYTQAKTAAIKALADSSDGKTAGPNDLTSL